MQKERQLMLMMHFSVKLKLRWPYVERAISAGVDARVEVWEGIMGAVGRLETAGKALTELADFLAGSLS